MAGKKTEVAYYIQKDWRWSPEVWGTLAKTVGIGIIIGIVLAMYAGCSDVAKDMKANVPCKPTTSQNSNDSGRG